LVEHGDNEGVEKFLYAVVRGIRQAKFPDRAGEGEGQSS
jgi:hypothetical protein